MYDKIINYGDSFTTAKNCSCDEDELWFRIVFQKYDNDKFLNRAMSGNSLEAIGLEVMHDSLTHKGNLLQIVSIPVLPRIMMYNDGWYEEEDLTYEKILDHGKRKTTLLDCQKYFETFWIDDIKDKHMLNMYHPTLIRAKMLSQVIALTEFVRKQGNEVIFVHMTEQVKEFDQRHPLISPFYKKVCDMDNYVSEHYSCRKVCSDAGIRPWDHEQYANHGHYGKDGHEYFAKIIKTKLQNFIK